MEKITKPLIFFYSQCPHMFLTPPSHVPLQVLHMFLKLLILLAPSPITPMKNGFNVQACFLITRGLFLIKIVNILHKVYKTENKMNTGWVTAYLLTLEPGNTAHWQVVH